MRYMLDTNACIYAINKKPISYIEKIEKLRAALVVRVPRRLAETLVLQHLIKCLVTYKQVPMRWMRSG